MVEIKGSAILIELYCDGSCKPTNPGPAGYGLVVVEDGKEIKRIAGFIGHGTNNVAEISGCEAALDYLIKEGKEWEEVVIVTDSQYCIGLFEKNHNAQKNVELVAKVRKKLEGFPNLTFRWVKGHNKDQFNEIADKLASGIIDSQPSANKK